MPAPTLPACLHFRPAVADQANAARIADRLAANGVTATPTVVLRAALALAAGQQPAPEAPVCR